MSYWYWEWGCSRVIRSSDMSCILQHEDIILIANWSTTSTRHSIRLSTVPFFESFCLITSSIISAIDNGLYRYRLYTTLLNTTVNNERPPAWPTDKITTTYSVQRSPSVPFLFSTSVWLNFIEYWRAEMAVETNRKL